MATRTLRKAVALLTVLASLGTAGAAEPGLHEALRGYLAEGPIETLRVQPGVLADDPREDLYFVLDVRTPEEFASGHIEGAVNVPCTDLLAHLDRLPSDTSEAILIYCEHATRSNQALMALRLLGYRNVGYLNGGLERWSRQGRPIITAGQ